MKGARTEKGKPAKPKSDVATQPKATTKRRTKILAQPTQEEIAKRAYDIYLSRGGPEEQAERDWLQAERELRER
ncbi:MAG TPA: DUF2934 domain-containing protein [Nitrospira sp.]|nr:DUF2934 domain-containing protein [Nitrospira sp.]